MDNKLHQQNGKNWREFQITEDSVVAKGSIHGEEFRSVLPFDVGLVSPQFDETNVRESSIFGSRANMWVALLILGLGASIGLFAIGEKNKTWIGPGLVLFISVFVGFFMLAVKSQPKKVPALIVYMGNSRLAFYCRNDIDRHNVESFANTLLQAQKSYFKQRYMTRNEATTDDQVRSRLSWLHDNNIIDDEELKTALKNLK